MANWAQNISVGCILQNASKFSFRLSIKLHTYIKYLVEVMQITKSNNMTCVLFTSYYPVYQPTESKLHTKIKFCRSSTPIAKNPLANFMAYPQYKKNFANWTCSLSTMQGINFRIEQCLQVLRRIEHLDVVTHSMWIIHLSPIANSLGQANELG
jgi:hypothetical protein